MAPGARVPVWRAHRHRLPVRAEGKASPHDVEVAIDKLLAKEPSLEPFANPFAVCTVPGNG
jgi:hypothetical protein